jgi:hypothetical protein
MKRLVSAALAKAYESKLNFKKNRPSSVDHHRMIAWLSVGLIGLGPSSVDNRHIAHEHLSIP